jgi:pyridoxine 5-phosphate synthase
LIAKKIRLGVNIDHAATLRQVRGGMTPYPDLIKCAEWSMKGGADLITIHLREDRRHIQDKDVFDLCLWRKLPINLELAVNSSMIKIAKTVKPDWTCFVPEKREELTTEGGLDVLAIELKLKKIIKELNHLGIKVSLFIAPDLEQVSASQRVGAQAIELHTGHWVLYKGNKKKQEWNRLVESSLLANELGLSVHAGHGLDYQSVLEIKKLPFLEEVNIGHSLICYSLEAGLEKSVKKMKQLLRAK